MEKEKRLIMKTSLSRILTMLILICLWTASIIMPSLAAAVPAKQPLSRQITRIGIIDQKHFAEKAGDGSYTGVNAEYVYKIAQYANLNIKITLYKSGPQALNDLNNGRLDMMCNVIKTPARAEKYLFTEYEVGRLPMCVFIRKNDDRFTFGELRQLSVMTYGAEQGSTVRELFTQFCSAYGIVPDIRLYANIDDIKAAVNDGKIDAGLYGSPVVEGFRTIQNFAPLPYYFIFRKSDTDLKIRVDNAMSNILSEDPAYYDRLTQKYDEPDASIKILTQEEKKYIAQHPDLTIAVVANDYPYYKNSNDQQPQGIIPDLYAKISQLTSLRPVYKVFATYEEATKAVARGEVDVLGIYSNGQIPAYSYGLRLTRAYDTMDMVLLTRTQTSIDRIRKIAVKARSGKVLALTISKLPNAETVSYGDTMACFEALKENKVDALVCGMPTATWLINQNQIGTYKMTTINANSMDICGATAYNNSTLCTILSKAVNVASFGFSGIVTDNTLPESRWDTSLARIPMTVIAAVTGVLLLLVICLIVALIQLRKRHKEQEAINQIKIATERREIELAALEKNIEGKNAFFSNISHDMRTPLNAILNFTRMAREKGLAAAKQEEYLDKVETSGTLLLDLINDTLTISKAGSGKLELHPEPLKAAELFDAIITPIQAAAEKKQITLITDRSAIVDRTILADKLCLQKIFLNLLTNAIKYTPAGGHVWFTLNNVKLENGQLDSVVTVKDDGIGISPAFLPHIFDPFTQENRTGYEAGGTGLGLAIVKQYVNLMGGTITVHSEINKGTEFNLHLCLKEVTAPQPAMAAAAPALATTILAGRQVLLCEDNKLNQEIAKALLKAKGMPVTTANNGEQGVEIFKDSPPGTFAVILMDIHMPVLDGLAATRRIRSLDRPDAQTIPVIAMTADAFEEDVQRCRAAGMNDHIAKPVSPELLYKKLVEVLTPKS